MLAVKDRIDEVSAGINAELGDKPWLGVFTFGERGDRRWQVKAWKSDDFLHHVCCARAVIYSKDKTYADVL
ncbi:MAG: hypothetical protein DCO97_02665 [Marivita sp. XM-24bin2]|jgi:hypothetical protein|nr:MAG: hypothetical protein DCO97_02665 [Marivita sp. XM-24bin2]